jgi:hypothetical protein
MSAPDYQWALECWREMMAKYEAGRPSKTVSASEAATEIGRLVSRILAIAPEAGLYIGIKIEPARNWKLHLDYAGEPMKPGEFRDSEGIAQRTGP